MQETRGKRKSPHGHNPHSRGHSKYQGTNPRSHLSRPGLNTFFTRMKDIVNDIVFHLDSEHNLIKHVPDFDGVVYIGHETWMHFEVMKPSASA